MLGVMSHSLQQPLQALTDLLSLWAASDHQISEKDASLRFATILDLRMLQETRSP